MTIMKKILQNFYRKLNIGEFNRIEKLYMILFVLSIASGIIYGIMNPDYFKPSQEAGNLDIQPGETSITIFYKNFFLSGISLITAGLSNLYFNFVTFSVISSFFYTSGTFLAIFIMLFTFGLLELAGIMFIGLTGLNLAEKFFGKILKSKKIKSKINSKRIFAYGIILLFTASLIEYGLALLLK